MQICRACERHIKNPTCPFCGGNATDAAPQVSPGLSRAQILAGVVLAGAVAAGCTDQQTPPLASTPPDGAARPAAQATPSAAVDAGRPHGSSLAGGYGAPPAR